MGVQIDTLANQPQFRGLLWQIEDDGWPQFIRQDPLAALYYADVEDVQPECVLVAWESRRPDTLVARGFCVPFAFGEAVGRTALPDGGWDDVVRWGWLDRIRDQRPTHLSALEISVAKRHRGTGLSARMLATMKDNGRRLGFDDLFAPVRPSGKSAVPEQPMHEYVARRRADGLPSDPWLRVHVRAGAEIVRIAPRSMTIAGSIEEWQRWTGQTFESSGEIAVPGALAPIYCSVEHDHAVYVEANVWVHHRLSLTHL